MVDFKRVLAGAVAGVVSAGAANAVVPFTVRYESEAPGVQNTTATFNVGGVYTFQNIPTGFDNHFSTDFGTNGQITGQYSGVQINNADQYGGAGGTGKYPVAFPNTPYEVKLSTTLPGGVNYFGYWLSALDPGNLVTFYSGGTELFQFRPQDVINIVNASPDPSQYYGNPNGVFAGQDAGEPFLFLNFFDTAGSFDKVVFQEYDYGGGYESDNHTVGNVILTQGQGAVVPLVDSDLPFAPVPTIAGVPEPASWALMLLGVGGMGVALRRRAGATAQA